MYGFFPLCYQICKVCDSDGKYSVLDGVAKNYIGLKNTRHQLVLIELGFLYEYGSTTSYISIQTLQLDMGGF